jgi:glycosyltransferase involved in cell wall biosynthesis
MTATAAAPLQDETPFVSVAIRSFRRLPQMIELVERLLLQDYPRFEIVVIEQSPEDREVHRAKISALQADPRVRILEYATLGAGRARVEAAKQCRGEIVLFMDDDDLPVHRNFIAAHAANFVDPLCMAVSGRQVLAVDEDPAPHNTPRSIRLCLRYSFLRMPRGRLRHTTRIEGVTQVAGGNASIRKCAIDRAGGWDIEDDHDEDSFNFRFARVKRPGEYFAYDPIPVMLRRLDVPGGLARRTQNIGDRIRAELGYSHRVVRKYHPVRFALFYPAYLSLASLRAIQQVHESQGDRSLASLVGEALHAGPRAYVQTMREIITKR